MKMPMGKFKGQPVEAMTTQYLVWLVTRDNIRFKYWALVKEALSILRSRDLGAMLDELKVDSLPDNRKTPEQIAERQKEKAEKLRQLEERRTAERLRRREEWRAQRDRADMQHMAEKLRQRIAQNRAASTAPPTGVIVDASHFVQQARQRPINTDVSDLI